MAKRFLLVALLATGSCLVQAQTKGTNTFGLGIGIQTQKVQNPADNINYNEQNTTGFTIGYGRFIKENEKIGVDLFYGNSKYTAEPSNTSSTDSYGGKLTYQKYFPIVKSFYAFGGARGGYNYSDGKHLSATDGWNFTANAYTLGAYGGVSWFFTRRFALEADLLAADLGYSKTKQVSYGGLAGSSNTSTNINLSTAGAINNLGFKIYFLF